MIEHLLSGFMWMCGVFIAGCLILLSMALVAKPSDKDSTDNPNGGRSGLRLSVDHQTGCHYLVAPGGGITPRLSRDGKHMCEQGGE